MSKPGARLRLFAATAFTTLALALALTSSPLAVISISSRSAEAAPTNTNSSNSIYYRQTGHYIKDAFLNFWLMNGGVALYGYPITEELNVDGVAMQYFQRARFEHRPESSRPWHVELTPVGSLLTQGRDFTVRVDPATVGGDRTYFNETGHSMGGAFKSFWNSRGGITIFGYPISEEIRENNRTVQYFERARFEVGAQNRIELGQVGAEYLHMQTAEMGDLSNVPLVAAEDRPGFEMSFRGEATWYSASAFNTTWERIIALNKDWGNLPDDFVGRGYYAAAPADLKLYGRMARVSRGDRSVVVQFIDVIAYADIPYVRSRGIVIDLAEEVYRALGTTSASRYEVNFDVFWAGEEP